MLVFPKLKPGTETRDVNQLLPITKIILLEGLKECTKKGIYLGISCTFRDAVCQHKEFLEGSSQVDSWGSMHQYRIAFDYFTVPKKYGGQLYNAKAMAAGGEIFRAKGCILGADFNNNKKPDDKFIDRPHIQLVSVKEQDEIIALYKKGGYEAIEKYVRRRLKR